MLNITLISSDHCIWIGVVVDRLDEEWDSRVQFLLFLSQKIKWLVL